MTDRCGSETGYQHHIRAGGTPPCAPCRAAHAEKRADYRRRRYLNHAPLSVEATGTRRRLQALAAIGWSLGEQSRRMGQQVSWAHSVTRRKWVSVATAAKVAALYDELAMIPGTNTRARNDASRRGWPVPLAWDDDSIDDPAVRPNRGTHKSPSMDEMAIHRAMHGDRIHLRPVERAEAVRRLTELGYSATEIAARIGVTDRSVIRLRSAS